MYETHGTECHFIHKRLIGAAVGLVTGGPGGAIGGFLQGGGSAGAAGGGCGGGLVSDGRGGCVQVSRQIGLSGRGGGLGASITRGRDRPGAIAAVQQFLPGGATGTFAAGAAVMGQWGAALEPAVVGEVQRADGSTGPLLRCLRGMVLGTDDLCYNKPLANGKRKWPRPTPPFLSGGDVKCIRRSIRLRKSKSSKKLLRELGMG